MDQPTEGVKPAKPAKPASPWMRGNLVTLGSAAVFTVYSAGYFRTREAADRFADESVQRHAAVAATPASNSGGGEPHAAGIAADTTPLPVMRLSSSAKGGKANEAKRSVLNAAAASTHAADSTIAPATSPPSPPVSAGVVAPAAVQSSPAPVSASATAAPATPAAPAAPAAPSPVAVAAPAVDSAEPATASANGQLKDGTYFGWGTSRHGDIQASVEIKSGKIVGAYISQCLTRYSCSWISALPPQVLQRQSPEVDYVSGATQSSNAFYYAIAEALKKAK
jgi:uncharacterized protein with FMN-binding domain